MADEKLNTGPEAQKTEEAPAPAVADPAHGEAAVPKHPPEQAGPAELGDVVMCSGRPGVQNFEKAILPGVPCNGRATRAGIRED